MTLAGSASERRSAMERDFWGHHLPSFQEALRTFERGPDPMTAAAFRILEPLGGTRVLDFGCGAGVTSAWLAALGAEVTGLDITPEAIASAHELCRGVGIRASFVQADLAEPSTDLPTFDRLFGGMALHHVDVATLAPILAKHLTPGGVGAFIETTASNPLLWFGRRYLVGRFGIPRFGTPDERPLARGDLAQLRGAFGQATFVRSEVHFLRIIDRQLLGFRHPRASAIAKSADEILALLPALQWLSYHRVVRVDKSRVR